MDQLRVQKFTHLKAYCEAIGSRILKPCKGYKRCTSYAFHPAEQIIKITAMPSREVSKMSAIQLTYIIRY